MPLLELSEDLAGVGAVKFEAWSVLLAIDNVMLERYVITYLEH